MCIYCILLYFIHGPPVFSILVTCTPRTTCTSSSTASTWHWRRASSRRPPCSRRRRGRGTQGRRARRLSPHGSVAGARPREVDARPATRRGVETQRSSLGGSRFQKTERFWKLINFYVWLGFVGAVVLRLLASWNLTMCTHAHAPLFLVSRPPPCYEYCRTFTLK